ncbi:MAG TPA: protein kinase [Vicinamibacterales bacterium]|nr:protein kinase [Vicinamibacterales bacterium]
MSLTSGTRLGPYEIVAPLGAGGMGEVYRARDTKLDRDVALKILPESFANDPDRLMRFTREAKTLASLNHPNIATIYGIEDNALVMELVEGRDLSEVIGALQTQGALLTLDDALPIARQIAEALEAAHDAGIVHRDLKPANIKVRGDGTVKVLDFGLAKAIDPVTTSMSGGSVANSPTMTSPALTAMGLILGTAAYMSPEQAKGRPVDKRADIWAFGVVLYEMLTGRRLFQAEDISETLAAVLTRDIASAMPAGIPQPLRALLDDCLVRDPRMRLRDIGEVRRRLDRFDPATAATTEAAPAPGSTNWMWPALAGVAGLAAAVLAAVALTRPAPAAPDAVTFEVTAPNLSTLVSISPDGRQLLYASIPVAAEPARLWLRPLGGLDARALPGTEGARRQTGGRVAWSPDSEAVVFSGPGALRRLDLVSGKVAELFADTGVLIPGAWNADGVVMFGRQRINFDARTGGVWRVNQAGGAATPVVYTTSGDQYLIPSGFLPDGRRFLYFAAGATPDVQGKVRLASIDHEPDAQPADAVVTADGPAVYDDGHLLYVSRGGLMAHPFDADRGVLVGDPVLLASGVASTIAVSETGHLTYREGGDSAMLTSELLQVDRQGRIVRRIGPPAAYAELAVLADGRRLAVSRLDRGAARHIQIVELGRDVFTRLTPGTQTDYVPVPSVDDLIAYTYSPDGESGDIYVRAANGVGDARALATSDFVKHPNHWSPDGRFLIYDEHVSGRAQDLLIVGKDGGTPIPFLTTDADETVAQFSPDGEWIAYRSTESGREEVYIRDFAPDRSPAHGTQKIQVSVDGGDKPRWSPTGKELFFFKGRTLMAVPVRTTPSLEVGVAKALFDTRPTSYHPFDVLPDGTFIINTLVDGPGGAAPPVRVLLHWRSATR